MRFTRDYFEDEVREGFYVPAMIKCCWAEQMDILEKVVRVCEKYNIKWFADCGTLIGAVRHQGFIPWDDDLDICMLRDDYIKFNEVVQKELPEGYKALNVRNEVEFEYSITRIVNGSKIIISDKYLQEHHGFPYVGGIDIFPLDFLSPDKKNEDARIKKVKRIWGIINTIDKGLFNEKEKESVISELEELCHATIDRNRPFKNALLVLIEEIFSEYPREGASHVALMPFWTTDGSHKYPIEYFKEEIKLPFENMFINVPWAYEDVLNIEYGDWTKIIRKGSFHDYPYYIEQEKTLANARGGKLPYRYYFSKDDMDSKDRKKDPIENDVYAKILQIIVKAHELFKSSIKNKEADVALELLEKCQALAIQVGEAIEKTQGEDFITVKMLEDYCEQVYQIHEKITAGQFENTRRECDILDKSIRMIQKSYRNDVKRKKEVVFFPYKASLWRYMESTWREFCDDPDYDVYVVPIPYYYKNPNGTLADEHYDLDEYPDYVNAISYLSFDYEHKYPEMMFIQNPYDETNYTISVHPFFYAKNLKNYTEQLVYIPCFIVDEIEPEDGKSVKNMENYVTAPGVIHADKVIVQSENMRKTYIDALTEFAGKGTRRVWEKKILGTGSLNYDFALQNKNNVSMCPDWWRNVIGKSDGSRKKTVLYYVGISSLLKHEENMIVKIKTTLEIFKKAKDDIALIWKPNPMIEENMVRLRPQLWKEYGEIVDVFRKEGWGIYDESDDTERVISISDAYYGDPGYLMNLCSRKGIPVMIQNI